MPNLFPQLKNVRWGPDNAQRYDVLRNPVRLPGGNPVLIYRHGGGAIQRDRRLPWIASGNGNPLAYWCSQQTDPPFDVISLGTRQAEWELPLTSHPKNQAYGWHHPDQTRSAFPPHSWDEFKLGILAVKSHSEELGINPDKIVVMGTSYGGDVMITLGLTAPIYSDDNIARPLSRYGMLGGYDSTVAGIIPHQVCADLRNFYQEKKSTIITTGLTYAEATKRLTLAGAFGSVTGMPWFSLVACGGEVRVTAGTGATLGTYGVDYVDPAGAFIQLDRSIGAGADGNAISISYTGYPQTIDVTGATWVANTKTLTSTGAFATFGHVGKEIQIYAGTGATIGNYRVTSRVSADAITLATSPGADSAGTYSGYLSGDQGYWFVFRNMFGANSNTEWDSLQYKPYKRALSALHYLERGITEWWVPTMLVSEVTGNGLIPYGALSGGDPHDHRQVYSIANAARARGLDVETVVPPNGWDDNDPQRDKHNDTIFRWMTRVVNTNVPRRLGLSNARKMGKV